MNTPQTRNTLGARWIWLITFLILALPTHAFYQIQDDFTDRSCNLLPNGQVNCVTTISQFPRYVQVTNETNDGLGNYSKTTQWQDFTDTFNMVYDPNTFTVNFSNAGDNSFQIALAGIVKNQSGRVYTWAQIHNAFPSFNPVIQIDKNNGYYKWSFNYTIPVAWRNQVDSWGFMFTKDNNTFGVSNNTISFLKAKVDMQQVFDAGWNVSFFNRTMILFDNNTIIQGTGLIDIDPVVSLNLSITGSAAGSLRANAAGYSTLSASTMRINRDSTALGQSCGQGFTQPCVGFATFNVSAIPTNATIISINFNTTILSTTNFGNGYAYAAYASPFYNNGTDNASSFYEWINATNTFNYTFANISQLAVFAKVNFTLSNTSLDKASKDLQYAITRNDPFNDNFTVALVPSNISTGNGGYIDFGGLGSSGSAPLLIVNYTADAPSIMYVSPTPANNTKTVVNWTYNNVTVYAYTNFSVYNDFNRSVLVWYNFETPSNSQVFDNSTYLKNAILSGGMTSSNYVTGIRGNGLRFNATASNFVQYATIDNDLNITNNNFSVSLWWNQYSSSSQALASKRQDTGAFWQILITASGWQAFQVLVNGVWYNATTSNAPLITNGTWHHLVGVFDNYSRIATIYRDGVNLTTVNNPGFAAPGTGTPLYLGARSGGVFFNGTLDEFVYYNRTLTTQEINASWEGGLYPYSNNFTNLPTGNYTYRACADDLFGAINCTENRTFMIGNSPPFVVHQDPSDQLSYAANTTVNFTSLAYLWESDKLIKNATLYGNFTGTWAINASNTTVLANASNYSFGSILLGYGAYLWNVFVCDTSNQCAFDGNFTVTMTTTTTTSTTTTTLSNVVDTTFKIGNEFWTMLPFVLLGIAFVLYGFVRGEWLYLVIGSFLLIMWGLTMMNQGYVLVYPMPYNSTGYSCNNTINTTSFPAFNITNASQSCYANQSSRITQVVNNNGTDAMIGFIIMLTGIGGMLYSILLAYEKWTKN